MQGSFLRSILRFLLRLDAPLALFILITLAFGALANVPKASAGPLTNNYFVAKTGHSFADPFLTRWAGLNGMETLGLPVTEPTVESNSLTQYFEYGALTGSKKVKAATNLQVVDVGTDLLALRHDPTRLVTGRRVGGERAATAFIKRSQPSNAKVQFDANTGHQISGRILGDFMRLGGEAALGAPLSDAYVSAGNRVQWFEFGRLEVRADTGPSAFGAAGLDLAVAKGIDIGKVGSNGFPDFDPARFREYLGDGTFPEAIGPFSPVEIVIPAINVDANIEQVAIVNGVMGIPEDPWAVAWYPVISQPGTFTNVVMAGHKDWWNIGPTVFWNLNQLVPGQLIYLIAVDGSGATYQISDSFAIDANANAQDIVSDQGTEMVTLITCDGAFDGQHYLQRWIVRAERI